MIDKRTAWLWLTISLLILTSLACNAFAGNLEPTPAPPTPAAPDGIDITPTPTAPLAPTATSDGTPGPSGNPRLTVLVDLNVREGPSVQYDRLGFLLEGEEVTVVGKDPATGWWKIACPDNVEGDECWVSGGEEYTRAVETDGVPVAEAPPTPTPVPPELGPGEGVMVYVDNGRLFAASLDLTQNPPTAGEPRQLAQVGNVQTAVIAPDGRRVAYVAGSLQSNTLNVVNIDGRDVRTLVNSEDMTLAPEAPDGFVPLVGRVAWLDAQTLIFNTDQVSRTGPGSGSQEDLLRVDIDGELTELFPPGEGGGAFAISAAGQVVLSRRDSLALADLTAETPTSETLATFGMVNTASEYIYYPRPQWTRSDGSYAAVPDADPWQAQSGATLWQIDPGGTAVSSGRIPGNILFTDVYWSRDGSRLIYIQQLMGDPSAVPQLIIANGSGANAVPYGEEGEAQRVFPWSPGEQSFVYVASSFYAIGQPDAAPRQIPLASGQQVADAQWINSGAFVTAVGFADDNSWTLISTNRDGTTAQLATLSSGPDVQLDVWAPE